MASTVVHVLAERGELGYDLRVADVWPEFAAHGKDTVTVRHLLCHTAGVPGLPPGTTPGDLCVWERICALLADAEPRWRPGTRFGYHSDTFGYLVGETVRRATGCTISGLLRDLITSPLGIAGDVHFGVPARLLPRVATQIDPEGLPKPPEPGSPQTPPMPMVIIPRADLANRRGHGRQPPPDPPVREREPGLPGTWPDSCCPRPGLAGWPRRRGNRGCRRVPLHRSGVLGIAPGHCPRPG
jgi:CubicO group peptidase (beta-lactamase class C family)